MPRPRVWKPFVLAASYVFYSAASLGYCLLLAGVTLANQLGAVLVHRATSERARKLFMGATVAVDLGVLGVFKYYGFFVDEIGGFLDSIGLGHAAAAAHAGAADRPELHHLPGDLLRGRREARADRARRRPSTSRST